LRWLSRSFTSVEILIDVISDILLRTTKGVYIRFDHRYLCTIRSSRLNVLSSYGDCIWIFPGWVQRVAYRMEFRCVYDLALSPLHHSATCCNSFFLSNPAVIVASITNKLTAAIFAAWHREYRCNFRNDNPSFANLKKSSIRVWMGQNSFHHFRFQSRVLATRL